MNLRGRRRCAGGDEGAGGVLAIAVVGATIVATLGVLMLGAALAARQQVSAAADAAALAAGDAILGVVAADPCALAADVARANEAMLTGCRVDGAEAYVTVQAVFVGIAMDASAHAGPPS